jgi:hypothetical protein
MHTAFSRHGSRHGALTALGLLVFVACSGAPAADVEQGAPSPTDAADSGTAPPTTTGTSTPPPAPAPDAGAKKAGACAGETSKQSCSSCCAKLHEDGAATYIGAIMVCMCEATTCLKACEKTLCNADTPAEPDGACNSCLQQQTSACSADIQSACAADADCMAFDACIADSGCLSK